MLKLTGSRKSSGDGEREYERLGRSVKIEKHCERNEERLVPLGYQPFREHVGSMLFATRGLSCGRHTRLKPLQSSRHAFDNIPKLLTISMRVRPIKLSRIDLMSGKVT